MQRKPDGGIKELEKLQRRGIQELDKLNRTTTTPRK